jgi:muconate cycloisomerase
MMKITGLELSHISVPFAEPYKLSKTYGTLHNAQAVILKVHTDEGIVGLGEADPMNPFTEETPGSVMMVMRDVIAPHIMGRDPTQMSLIETTLDKAVHGNLLARGAINMALYDILGKARQCPVHTFLGGIYHKNLPLLGAVGSGSAEEDSAKIEALAEQGYRTVMIKMGALPIDEEIQRMISAANRFGEEIAIILDPNQGWQLKQALRFVEGIHSYPPAMIEQPIDRCDIAGLKKIRDRTPFPLSVDESLVSIHDATVLIRERAADVFSIKVSKNGGLSKSLVIAKIAEAFGLKCLMNSMLEFGISQAASLQLGCTLNNLVDMGHAYMSVLRLSDDVTDFERNISDAIVSVPQGNGLGISLDDDKLKMYTKDYLNIEA